MSISFSAPTVNAGREGVSSILAPRAFLGPLPRNILADQIIRFTGTQAVKSCPHLLRRVVVWDPVNEREIVFLTVTIRDLCRRSCHANCRLVSQIPFGVLN